MKDISFSPQDGSSLRIGIVVANWNNDITNKLLRGCKQALKKNKVKATHITVVHVPGAFELPFAARTLIETESFDAIVVLGCLIKGETLHFEVIAQAVANGVMELNVDEEVPVIFGVLTCLTEQQAKKRSQGKENHGILWGQSAVHMALLKKQSLS